MDVGGWLRGLGLGQYEEKFRDNKIDADLLPRLTVDDLKDIGVSVVGDRRRLLDAIAVIAGTGPASPTKSAPSKGLQASAERRPITVMFCDLVGSTSMAAKLDAEDWRNLVNAYLDQASTAVAGLGGHVLKKLGDGLMALFGYPHAQENDAERAVRAALAIQRALADLNARNAGSGAPELSARIGIECGSVVVDATGEVFGEAPNVAARVQAAAEPGSVLITGSVQRQVAGLFVVEEKGARELKGVAQPLSLYRVVRASGGGRRSGVRALTRFVGREEDIGALLRRWDRVRAGEGQFVQIVGEPGLGKSRLVEEFHSRLGETPHTWVEWNSSQLLQNTPLHPIAEWGRARFGGQDVAAERRLTDLETTLAQVKLDVQETATLLAPLLDIPLPAERAPKFGPEELRRRQLAAMVALLLAGARTQPVVLAFEDLHWADPTSLDLIQSLAERGAQAPILVVATTRPEFRAPWGMRSHHAVVALAPLDRTEVRRMVGEIAAQHALPQEVVERVSERTGGVPLFVEEVTRLLVERGEQGGVQAIPPTLQQSLAARLDRLGAAREIAQIGAVLGREFTYALLRDVAEIDEPVLQASLDRLADADLLFVEGAQPQANYRFKHALIQDAAYDSLLKSRRQALHRRAAELLRDDSERAAAEPEPIAHHFTEAGLDDLAIEWWGKAGDQSLRRSAFQEAIAHLGKAIAMADKAQGGKAGDSGERARLHAAYANALIPARGYGAAETTEAFARARESAAGHKDAPEQLAADYGLWTGSIVRGELSAAREHSTAFLSDVEARPDSPEAGVAYRIAGSTHWSAGEYPEAREHQERALALFQPGRDDDLAFRFGHDAGVAAMRMLALTLWPLGEVDRAVFLVAGAQARTAGLTHVGTSALERFQAVMFELMRGDHARAAPNAAELARLAREHGLPFWGAFGVFLEGLARLESGAPGDGLADMRRGVDLLREQNILLYDGLIKIALAEAEARADDVERALAILDEALATCDRTGYRAFEAELHRVRGEMVLTRDRANPAPAEEALQTAIAVARRQATRSFQLRAALALAKLYQSTARPVDAHAVLAPALEGFASTPEMQEIAEAQALLGALAETEEVKATETERRQRLHLQTAYGHAVMWSKGFAAEETKAAFARAAELAAKRDDFSERFAAAHGQWTMAHVRGELRSARELMSTFLREAEEAGRVTEAGVARRGLALISYLHGDFVEARTHCERALAISDPEHEEEARERYGEYTGTVATACLAVTTWHLGEIEHARELIEIANRRATELGHPPSMAGQLFQRCKLEILRGDATAALSAAEALEALSREHGLALFRLWAELFTAWARGRLHDPAAAAAELRQALATLTDQGQMLAAPFFYALLAELEAQALGAERALARIDEALALADQIDQRDCLSSMHRIRGEILLKRDPPSPALAEEAFQTAVAVAKEQGARSLGLRAALSLAKLYQSTARPADANAVLAPALDGFTPTPEMPEIAEAQALLMALAEVDEVKTDMSRRQRLLHLQSSYGQAVMWKKGITAEETRDAFARADELAVKTGTNTERNAIYFARWIGNFISGKFDTAREIAVSFLREAETEGSAVAVAAAHRALGWTCLFQGELTLARGHSEEALVRQAREPNLDAIPMFGLDVRVSAKKDLALSVWLLGDAELARCLIEQAVLEGQESGHIATIANTIASKGLLDAFRDDPVAARQAGEDSLRFARRHDMAFFTALGEILLSWARGRLIDPEVELTELRRTLTAQVEKGYRAVAPFYYGLIGDLEGRTGHTDLALASLDTGLAISKETGECWTDPFLFHQRGAVLLQRSRADPAPAEDAFRTAIQIAQRQGSRSFGLRATLSLAKLYQSTGRPVEAHAILAPALEGFAPTPEMPEIAEAQALLAELAETDEVKAAEAQRQRRLHLQTAYGQAMMWAKGFSAEETSAAFSRATQLAAKTDSFADRFAAGHFQWTFALLRGELRSARELELSFLKEAEDTGRVVEAGVARRGLAFACYQAADFFEARAHCERALDTSEIERERETQERFQYATGPLVMSVLAVTMWQLGEVERARELIEQANRRGSELGHGASKAHPFWWKSRLEILRGDAAAALSAAKALEDLSQEHGMPFWRTVAELSGGWARGRLHDAATGAEDLRRALADRVDQDAKFDAWFFTGLLAELEAETLGAESALARLDEAMALARQVETRCNLPFLHLLRGKLFLERDPSNPAPAEEAFQTAFEIAKEQGARSWGLRAALALAKLYQSTGRAVEAHALLAPALEGFSPTPEMPEIAEAQALLVAIEAGAHVRHE